MKILTEPVGSIPRPSYLLEGMRAHANREIDEVSLNELFGKALRETIRKFEEESRLS